MSHPGSDVCWCVVCDCESNLMSYDEKNLTFLLEVLNLFNSLRQRNKMLGKPRMLSLFPDSFNKFNKT